MTSCFKIGMWIFTLRLQTLLMLPLWSPPPLHFQNSHWAPLLYRSCYLQSTCFQLITGHSFQANYSNHFWQGTGDNTSCPLCEGHYTLLHILRQCYALSLTLTCDVWISHLSIPTLFSTFLGTQSLTWFLHYSQALLRPFLSWPDPPWKASFIFSFWTCTVLLLVPVSYNVYLYLKELSAPRFILMYYFSPCICYHVLNFRPALYCMWLFPKKKKKNQVLPNHGLYHIAHHFLVTW